MHIPPPAPPPGKQVEQLRHHHALVRDCSWHPHLPLMASVCWDGAVVAWDNVPPEERGGKGRVPNPGEDKQSDWY